MKGGEDQMILMEAEYGKRITHMQAQSDESHTNFTLNLFVLLYNEGKAKWPIKNGDETNM